MVNYISFPEMVNERNTTSSLIRPSEVFSHPQRYVSFLLLTFWLMFVCEFFITYILTNVCLILFIQMVTIFIHQELELRMAIHTLHTLYSIPFLARLIFWELSFWALVNARRLQSATFAIYLRYRVTDMASVRDKVKKLQPVEAYRIVRC
jgi:hypothetical protein